MHAIHLAAHHIAGGVEPLCGSWGGMDTGWTTVVSEVTCAACAARLASSRPRSEEAPGSRASWRVCGSPAESPTCNHAAAATSNG
jgi:hypothetical protein